MIIRLLDSIDGARPLQYVLVLSAFHYGMMTDGWIRKTDVNTITHEEASKYTADNELYMYRIYLFIYINTYIVLFLKSSEYISVLFITDSNINREHN